MKVLFTFFVPSGGVETLNRQRISALKAKGVTCHFLYLQQGSGLQNKYNAPVFIAKDDDEIKHILQNGYDAIIVGSDLQLLRKLRNIGYTGLLVYEIQGLGNNKEYAEIFLKNHASPIIKQHADGILYPKTPHLVNAFVNNLPHIPKYSFHNCFNFDEFHYEEHPKHSQPILGWVGRLEENKNWRDFIKIGAQLIKVKPETILWMFEDKSLAEQGQREAFHQMINKLHLNKHIKVFSNEPHRMMAKHFSIIGDSGGFLCSTSKVEGFGYAVLEAMVCKCPVLSTDSDGVRSFIKHNRTGKFFRLGDINHAVREGKELMINLSLREGIRTNGLKHIHAHFAPEPYANNFIDMINDLNQRKQEN